MIPAPFLFRPALHYFPMKITSRILVFSLLLAPIIFAVAGGSTDKPAANRKYLVFVGTYTTKTESKGIYAYEFDADTGRLTHTRKFLCSPFWLCRSQRKRDTCDWQ